MPRCPPRPPAAPTRRRLLRRPGSPRRAATTTSITLGWNASTDNVAVTGYTAYNGATSAGNATTTSYTFTGLACGTTYTLGVEAYDAAGNRSTRSTFSASTSLCADTTPPSVPQGLHTAAATQTSITLAWNASTDNIGVVGYHMYRDNMPVADTPSLTYTFAGLTCGTLYNLALEAYDARGNVSYRPQAVAVVTTNACNPDSQAPTTPTGLSTSGVTATQVTVSWSASTDNIGVTGYGRYVNGSLASSGTGTSFTFTSLTCNTAYTLGIDSYDAAGNRSSRASINATTSACTAPPRPRRRPRRPDRQPPISGSTRAVARCTRQATAGAYDDAQACASFEAAYGAAASGDTVRVRAGTYGAQFFAGGVGASQGEGSKALTFVGETGNMIRQIHIGSNNLTFDGMNIDAGGVKTSGAAFENSGSSFLFKNGRIGNVLDEKGAVIDGAGAVFDNVLFHDVVLQGAGVHLECIQAYAVPNFTLRNSTFTNCGIMGLSLGYPGWWSPCRLPYSGVVMEGNTFNAPVPSNNYALAIWSNKDSCNDTCGWGVMTNYRIRNNYIWSLMNRMTTDSSTVICGNRGPGASAAWAAAC